MFPVGRRLHGVFSGFGRLLARLRPRPATVIALLALSFSLSGVAYAANTIGSIDVIDNTLQSVDLKNGAAVKGIDVVDNSLVGADIDESTLNGVARKLLYAVSPTIGIAKTTILTFGGYAIKAACFVQPTIPVKNSLVVYVNGPAGDLQMDYTHYINDATAQPDATGRSIPAGTDSDVISAGAQLGDFNRVAGTFWIQTGTTLLEMELHGVADFRGGTLDRCFLRGMVTKLI